MTTLNTEMTKTDTAERELTIDELDSASGGCPAWLGVLAVAVAFGALVRRLF